MAIRGGCRESVSQLVLSACIDGVVTDLKAANCRVRRGKHKVMKKFLTPGRLSGRWGMNMEIQPNDITILMKSSKTFDFSATDFWHRFWVARKYKSLPEGYSWCEAIPWSKTMVAVGSKYFLAHILQSIMLVLHCMLVHSSNLLQSYWCNLSCCSICMHWWFHDIIIVTDHCVFSTSGRKLSKSSFCRIHVKEPFY